MSSISKDISIALQRYHKTNHAGLEIEFPPLIIEKEEYLSLFSSLMTLASNVSHTETVVSKSTFRERNSPVVTTLLRSVHFKDGQNTNTPTYLQKKSLYRPIQVHTSHSFLKEYSMYVYEYTSTPFHVQTPQIQEMIILRSTSFQFKKDPKWIVEVSFVKKIQNKSDMTTRLKTFKDALLKKYIQFPEDVDPSTFDYIMVRICTSNEQQTIHKREIDHIISFLESCISPGIEQQDIYQSTIHHLSKFIYTDPILIRDFQKKSGFKRLVNNVIELNRTTYFSTVLPHIDAFYITDKIDGQRCFILILETKQSTAIQLLSDRLYTIRQYTSDSPVLITDKDVQLTVLDAEIVYTTPLSLVEDAILDQSSLDIYVFDVVILQNQNIAHHGFEKRVTYFPDVERILHTYSLGTLKKFVKLEKDSYVSALRTFYKEAQKHTKYEIDGLIFTPTSALHTSHIMRGTKAITINTTYATMQAYKWKPIDKLTIDFYIAHVSSDIRQKEFFKKLDTSPKEEMYVVCSGVNIQTFQQLRMECIPYYKDIIPAKYHRLSYFPIPFSPDDQPFVYTFFSKKKDLHNRIGEFLYVNNAWKLLRIREDRNVELNRGEYYGNALKYAELIWHSIKHPFQFEDLLKDINTAYFAVTSEDTYIHQRNFNSFVKSEIIRLSIHPMKHLPSSKEWVMDLACGKGQDLMRLMQMGFKNIVMIDKDMDAIHQLLDRKYNLHMKKKGAYMSKHKQEPISSRIYTRQLDLSESYKKNIDHLQSLPIPKKSMDVILCNFAIHYFMGKEEDIQNFLLFMHSFLKPNGRFIFTCFDGQRVFDVLQTNDTMTWREGTNIKYSIQRRYQSDQFTDLGQKIGVILPFTNREYYDEYLVNLQTLRSMLTKLGFQQEISDSFGSMLPKFKKVNAKEYTHLSTIDKEFVSLYSYNVFIKNTKSTPSEENIPLLLEKL